MPDIEAATAVIRPLRKKCPTTGAAASVRSANNAPAATVATSTVFAASSTRSRVRISAAASPDSTN